MPYLTCPSLIPFSIPGLARFPPAKQAVSSFSFTFPHLPSFLLLHTGLAKDQTDIRPTKEKNNLALR